MSETLEKTRTNKFVLLSAINFILCLFTFFVTTCSKLLYDGVIDLYADLVFVAWIIIGILLSPLFSIAKHKLTRFTCSILNFAILVVAWELLFYPLNWRVSVIWMLVFYGFNIALSFVLNILTWWGRKVLSIE